MHDGSNTCIARGAFSLVILGKGKDLRQAIDDVIQELPVPQISQKRRQNWNTNIGKTHSTATTTPSGSEEGSGQL